jgi:hypothetical protein
LTDAIQGDASRLWKDFRMNLSSCVELGLAFKLVFPETTRPRAFYSELVGLVDVAEHVCGMKLDKSQRETDWSKSVLSSEQLQCELPSSCPVTAEDIYIMIRRGD